MLKMQK